LGHLVYGVQRVQQKFAHSSIFGYSHDCLFSLISCIDPTAEVLYIVITVDWLTATVTATTVNNIQMQFRTTACVSVWSRKRERERDRAGCVHCRQRVAASPIGEVTAYTLIVMLIRLIYHVCSAPHRRSCTCRIDAEAMTSITMASIHVVRTLHRQRPAELEMRGRA